MAVINLAFILWGVTISTVLCDDPRVSISATDPPLHPIDDMIVQEKDKDVQLTCIVENKRDDYDVLWTVIGNSPNASKTQVTTATRSHDAFKWAIDNPSPTAWRLRIQNVQVSSEGTYTCSVQVGPQSYIEDQRQLKVVQKPQISDLDTSSDMTKNYDSNADLECYATGRPEPLVKWSRMAGELLPSGGTEYQGNVLRIDRVAANDAGIYKCTAQNSAGEDEREIRVSVLFPPEVTTSTPSVKQKIGYVKEMVCNIKGYPVPTSNQISWMHEALPVVSEGRIEIRNIMGALNRVTSVLTIYGVQREDFGSYTCSASNDRGSNEVTMALYESDQPTADRSDEIRSAASLVSLHLATFFMLVSVCLLQTFHLGR